MTTTTEERTCDRCGAQNPATAEFCWQCYQRFAGPSAAPLPHAAYGRSEPPTARAEANRSGKGRGVLAAAAIALILVAGFFAWRMFFGGLRLPDTVGGHERIESEEMSAAEDILETVADLTDVEIHASFYGTGEALSYSIVAIEIPEGRDMAELLSALEAQESGPPAAVPGPDGTMPLQCRSWQDMVGECAWAAGDLYVGVQGYGISEGQLRSVANEVRGDIG